MSQTAAVSSRQELYPRGMAAERALRLGIGALSGLGVGEARKASASSRSGSGSEAATPKPSRFPITPNLTRFWTRLVSMFAGTSRQRLTTDRIKEILFTSGSSVPARHSTATSARHVEVTPDVAEARPFEERLQHAYADGGFLVLTVRPSRMRRCGSGTLRRFDLERVSFDDLLFDALREEAKELEIDWSIIEQADGADPSSQDWKNLLHLVGRAAPKITADLAAAAGASAAGASGADRPLRPDVDSGDAAGQGGARRALSRPLGAGGDGRAERHADSRSCGDSADHAGPAGQGVRRLDR